MGWERSGPCGCFAVRALRSPNPTPAARANVARPRTLRTSRCLAATCGSVAATRLEAMPRLSRQHRRPLRGAPSAGHESGPKARHEMTRMILSIAATHCHSQFCGHSCAASIPRAKRAAPAVARGVRLSCRGHLTRTGGRDGAETHGEDWRERGIGEQGQNSPIDLQANVPTRRLKRPSRASDAPRFVVARDSPVAKRSGCPTNGVRSLAKQGRKRPSANRI